MLQRQRGVGRHDYRRDTLQQLRSGIVRSFSFFKDHRCRRVRLKNLKTTQHTLRPPQRPRRGKSA